MKRLVEFPLEGGSAVVVEVEEPTPTSGTVRGLRAGELTEKAKESFETALEKIRPAATVILAKLRDLSERPDEVGVEFGIRLSAEAGAFIASTGAEANFKVTLTWRRKE
jgi:hypothetical protein